MNYLIAAAFGVLGIVLITFRSWFARRSASHGLNKKQEDLITLVTGGGFVLAGAVIAIWGFR